MNKNTNEPLSSKSDERGFLRYSDYAIQTPLELNVYVLPFILCVPVSIAPLLLK